MIGEWVDFIVEGKQSDHGGCLHVPEYRRATKNDLHQGSAIHLL